MSETRVPISTPTNRSAQEKKYYIKIEGQLLDGLTGEPVIEGNVHLSIRGYDEKGKGWLEQHRYATSNADGRYGVENVSAKMLEKSRLALTYELTGIGYVGSRYYETDIKKDTRIVKDFGLLPVDGAALFSGAVKDVVDERSFDNIDVEVDIQELNVARRWNSIKKIRTTTNELGEYALKVDAQYLDAIERKYFCRVEPMKEGYEIAIHECTCGPKCGPHEESEKMVNFTVQVGDFHLVNLNQEATLAGELKDSEGAPIKDTEIKIELGHRSGCGCGCGQGVVDSEIEAKTDENGKFNCAVPLKFLYGSNYWLSVSVEPDNEDAKRSYERVLQPGQAERIIEDNFEDGMIFRLAFSASQ